MREFSVEQTHKLNPKLSFFGDDKLKAALSFAQY